MPAPKPLRRNPAIANRLKNSDASFQQTGFTSGKRCRLESSRSGSHEKTGGFFCIAGLWEKWHRPHREGELGLDDTGPGLDQIVESFTIITTTPNQMVAKVHDRMPVILGPEHYSWWLEPKFEPEFLKTLLRPYPANDMDCRSVSKQVNSAKFDGPECLG